MNFARLTLIVLVLAAALVGSARVLSRFFVRVKQEQAIAVKGYAEKEVRSDAGKFTVTVGARGAAQAEAIETLKHRRQRILEALRARGFAEADIRLLAPEQRKILRKDAQGKDTNEIEYFDLYQTITVQSGAVDKIYEASLDLPNLLAEGIDLNVSAPEFLLTSMETLKRDLLAKATEDGYQRARVMAENSGGRVGELVSAQQGVIQITAPLSTETSSWGLYDTTTIEKTAKVVVSLQYAILPGPR